MHALAIHAGHALHDGQHQQQHGGGAQHALVAHDLQGRDGEVGHEEILECDLGRLDALARDDQAHAPQHVTLAHGVARAALACATVHEGRGTGRGGRVGGEDGGQVKKAEQQAGAGRGQ